MDSSPSHPTTAATRTKPGRTLRRTLFKPLLTVLVLTLLTAAFATIASEVMEGDTRALDIHLAQLCHALRQAHPWLAQAMRDISALGSTTVLTLFTTAVVVYLVLVFSRTTALMVALSALSGTALVHFLKEWFARARPDISLADHVVQSMSFPSGHASMSAIIFLTLGALTASTRTYWRERLYILATACGLTFLVGTSRIVLGVHWFTDVLGGWALGAAWAMAWLLITFRFARPRERAEGSAAVPPPQD